MRKRGFSVNRYNNSNESFWYMKDTSQTNSMKTPSSENPDPWADWISYPLVNWPLYWQSDGRHQSDSGWSVSNQASGIAISANQEYFLAQKKDGQWAKEAKEDNPTNKIDGEEVSDSTKNLNSGEGTVERTGNKIGVYESDDGSVAAIKAQDSFLTKKAEPVFFRDIYDGAAQENSGVGSENAQVESPAKKDANKKTDAPIVWKSFPLR